MRERRTYGSVRGLRREPLVYSTQKPCDDDEYDIEVQNQNWDKNDAALKDLERMKISIDRGDISETAVDALDSVTEKFPVPETGEKTKTFLGKVKKSLEDWKIFKESIITVSRLINNGLTTEPGIAALDAHMGKTLQDQLDTANHTLGNTLREVAQYAADIPDLNTLFDYGIHTFTVGNSTEGKNLPSSGLTGKLVVSGSLFPNHKYATQIFYGNNGITYFRIFVSDWEKWKSYTTSDDALKIERINKTLEFKENEVKHVFYDLSAYPQLITTCIGLYGGNINTSAVNAALAGRDDVRLASTIAQHVTCELLIFYK